MQSGLTGEVFHYVAAGHLGADKDVKFLNYLFKPFTGTCYDTVGSPNNRVVNSKMRSSRQRGF